MSHPITPQIVQERDQYQLRIGRWESLWVWAGGLAELEALKAEVEADDDKAQLVDSLGGSE